MNPNTAKTGLNRDQFVLAGMSAAELSRLSPVQVQKLFFLLDKQIGPQLGGPHFDFKPYHYGPFDKEVYDVLNELESFGKLEKWQSVSPRSIRYVLTPSGYREGKNILEGLKDPQKKYIRDIVNWLKDLSFTELVSAIYRHYPEMKVNSVFRSGA